MVDVRGRLGASSGCLWLASRSKSQRLAYSGSTGSRSIGDRPGGGRFGVPGVGVVEHHVVRVDQVHRQEPGRACFSEVAALPRSQLTPIAEMMPSCL